MKTSHTTILLIKFDDLIKNDKEKFDEFIQSRIDKSEDAVALTDFKYKVVGHVAPILEKGDSGCVILAVDYNIYSKLQLKYEHPNETTWPS